MIKNFLLFTDNDECHFLPCPEVASCVNTPGSYTCLCPLGYHQQDAYTCTGRNNQFFFILSVFSEFKTHVLGVFFFGGGLIKDGLYINHPLLMFICYGGNIRSNLEKFYHERITCLISTASFEVGIYTTTPETSAHKV